MIWAGVGSRTVVVMLLAAFTLAGCSSTSVTPPPVAASSTMAAATTSPPVVAPVPVVPVRQLPPEPVPVPAAWVGDRASLTWVDSWAVTPDAPIVQPDVAPAQLAHIAPIGAVVHVTPGGVVIGWLPALALTDPTVTPVLATAHGGAWLQVMLPSRAHLPEEGAVNGAAGWIHLDDVTELSPVAATVLVDLTAQTLTVLDAAGAPTLSTSVAVVRPDAPTPLGWSFVVGSWEEDSVTPSVVALSMHSETLAEFDGEDAVTAVHRYRGATNGAVSSGCVRVPDSAWVAVGTLPVGTPVLVVRG